MLIQKKVPNMAAMYISQLAGHFLRLQWSTRQQSPSKWEILLSEKERVQLNARTYNYPGPPPTKLPVMNITNKITNGEEMITPKIAHNLAAPFKRIDKASATISKIGDAIISHKNNFIKISIMIFYISLNSFQSVSQPAQRRV